MILAENITVIIYGDLSPMQIYAERLLRDEEAISPRATEKNTRLHFTNTLNF